MNPKLLAVLRDRVTRRFYDRSDVIDQVARAIVREVGIGRTR